MWYKIHWKIAVRRPAEELSTKWSCNSFAVNIRLKPSVQKWTLTKHYQLNEYSPLLFCSQTLANSSEYALPSCGSSFQVELYGFSLKSLHCSSDSMRRHKGTGLVKPCLGCATHSSSTEYRGGNLNACLAAINESVVWPSRRNLEPIHNDRWDGRLKLVTRLFPLQQFLDSGARWGRQISSRD